MPDIRMPISNALEKLKGPDAKATESYVFDSIRASIVSPEQIKKWSFGEVLNSDTMNYRTFKPEKEGLFCHKIFGPTVNYECACRKLKGIKHKGAVCEKCHVEITLSRVRRERMGHIELAAPVVHIWFFKSLPSKIATLLDRPMRELQKVLYFESHIVVDPCVSDRNYGDLLTEEQLREVYSQFGSDGIKVGIGAEAIRTMLTNLDLVEEAKALRAELTSITAETKRKKIVKRLKLIEDFIASGNKPEWMVLTVLPILPPDLRPLVMLDGGRFATSDLNELYRRVINRNNRLKKLMGLNAPEIILRNEKRMLQESVDALFDNSRGKGTKAGAVSNGANKDALRSLSDMLKGKQGRFRQNLLGKRVDYSGRSVIVVGPELKLHQCGLPKKMALELFKPFVYAKLEEKNPGGITLKFAKKMVESEHPKVWDALEEVICEHPVLLNRAPTLHRLGIQAFEPILIEGKAIQLHPLVCAAFNADFDGDQMAVHVPVSIESRVEARTLMMSTNNILSPQNGKPIIVPTQDMVLGLYYMTVEIAGERGEGKIYSSIAEIEHALHAEKLSLHAKIKYRRKKTAQSNERGALIVETTPGRVILAELLPDDASISFDLVNKLMTKKEIGKLVEYVYKNCGQKKTVIFADQLMQIGFKYACNSGISMGKEDMLVPAAKKSLIEEAEKQVREYELQHGEGLITEGEKYNKVIDAWTHCSEKIAQEMMEGIAGDRKGHQNSVYMMANSGARGSAAQIRQLAGMRGLMAKSSGEIIEEPIKSNFKEGLTILEYFISTHGARKGLADTALKTANSGHLTRRLVDVSQDSIITKEDCGTTNGMVSRALIENGDVVEELSEAILGRVSATNIQHPTNGDIIVRAGQMIDERVVELIDEAGIEAVKIRSVITCENKLGVCAKCYGRDLSTAKPVNVGEAVGVVAAQSIGEPGTQLTMRTFHIGGVATKSAAQSSVIASHEGEIKISHRNVVIDSQDRKIVMSRSCEMLILDEKGNERAKHKIPYGSKLFVDDGDKVMPGKKMAEWDPFTIPIITERSGVANFVDLISGVSMREILDESTGIVNRVVVDWRQQAKTADLRPRIILHDENGNVMTLANGLEARYMLPVDVILNISDKQMVNAGDVIARIPKEASKTRDITGGLPRVVELFEARKPKNLSVIAEIDGYIEFGKDFKSKRRIIIRSANTEDPNTQNVEYLVPRGKHIVVNEGDFVSKGDMLMDGTPSPHDILRVMGVEAFAKYMIGEIQQVYRLQGVKIDDKHIEVVLRQMLRKVEVVDPGETTFLTGQQVDREIFETENLKAAKQGFMPAVGITVVSGLTRAALNTDSFLSAASFQETTRVLTEAAVAGKVDHLRGLKEVIIIGGLIPAGTGYYVNQMKKAAHKIDKKVVREEDDNKKAS